MGNFDGLSASDAQSATGERTVSISETTRDVEDALLAALAGMAVRSHRRQADLDVAVRRAGLALSVERLQTALRNLEHDGCVDQLVPLADGGVLLSVTGHGIERISHTARRHVVALD